MCRAHEENEHSSGWCQRCNATKYRVQCMYFITHYHILPAIHVSPHIRRTSRFSRISRLCARCGNVPISAGVVTWHVPGYRARLDIWKLLSRFHANPNWTLSPTCRCIIAASPASLAPRLFTHNVGTPYIFISQTSANIN